MTAEADETETRLFEDGTVVRRDGPPTPSGIDAVDEDDDTDVPADARRSSRSDDGPTLFEDGCVAWREGRPAPETDGHFFDIVRADDGTTETLVVDGTTVTVDVLRALNASAFDLANEGRQPLTYERRE